MKTLYDMNNPCGEQNEAKDASCVNKTEANKKLYSIKYQIRLSAMRGMLCKSTCDPDRVLLYDEFPVWNSDQLIETISKIVPYHPDYP